jgi:hypothetical protein
VIGPRFLFGDSFCLRRNQNSSISASICFSYQFQFRSWAAILFHAHSKGIDRKASTSTVQQNFFFRIGRKKFSICEQENRIGLNHICGFDRFVDTVAKAQLDALQPITQKIFVLFRRPNKIVCRTRIEQRVDRVAVNNYVKLVSRLQRFDTFH